MAVYVKNWTGSLLTAFWFGMNPFLNTHDTHLKQHARSRANPFPSALGALEKPSGGIFGIVDSAVTNSFISPELH